MSEDDEPSILEYSRFYGLTTDHRSANALSTLVGKHIVDPATDETALFQITANVAPPAPERLSAGKEAVAFLSSIRADQLDSSEFADELIPKTHRRRKLKIEEPLLRSDHTLDMQQFGGWIIPDLANERLPLEKVNDEEDEGLVWPSKYDELRSSAANKSESEKLVVSKDILLYLNGVLQQHEAETGPLGFGEATVIYQRNAARDPMTPPLLPMSPELLPYIPSSDICNLELLSDQTSPCCEELRRIEGKVRSKDALVSGRPSSGGDNSDSASTFINSNGLGDLFSPLKDLKEPPILPSFRRRRTEDLKVDGPLTPPRLEQISPGRRKKVSFQEALLEIIPDLPSSIPSPEEISSDDIDRFFEENIRPIAEKVDRSLEQEQLQEVDTTQRVPVPVMDFSRPLAPWKASTHPDINGSDRKELLLRMKKEYLGSSFWPLSGTVERSLSWKPFPTQLAKVAEQEDMDGGEDFADLVSQPDCIDHTTLVWKPDGLRLFDEDASDMDEIGFGQFPETFDFQSLLKKRKLELDEEADHSNQTGFDTRKRRGAASSELPREESHVPFSAMESIENFMSIRSGEGKRKKLMESSYFSADRRCLGSEAPKLEPVVMTEPPIAQPNLVRKIYQAPPPPPLPQLIIPKDRRSFIISSSFLADRYLFRSIQSLYPTADFIERDFTLHSASAFSVPLGPPPRPSTATTLANEADILLSPSSGLITTTLQKIAQRPLPGSTSLSPIFNRILLTAPRYDTLFILVTDGKPYLPTTTDFSSATVALTSTSLSLTPLLPLQAFLSTLPLPNAPSVILIPSETSSSGNPLLPLATYIVHLMITHSFPSGSPKPKPPSHASSNTDYPFLTHRKSPPPIQLRQEETNWELFLRRAGMNAYAAQAVLASLRPPVLDRRWERLDMGSRALRPNVDGAEDVKKQWGLAAFVRMSHAERVRKFEGMIGRGMLERVGRVLDGRW